MFFRREKQKAPTFEERLKTLRVSGFETDPDGNGVRVSRGGCAAIVEDRGAPHPFVHRAGWTAGGEIGLLVDGGYQKFWRTPSGKQAPALASQLQALHAFEEDLKEALGLESLYNESLGTVNDLHLYDRVAGRDHGRSRPWDRQQPK